MSKDQPFAEMKQKCFMKNEDVFEIDEQYVTTKQDEMFIAQNIVFNKDFQTYEVSDDAWFS